MLKIFRLTHLYFGVFIAPALLFFALTGALQTFGLHESNRDHPDYHPAKWIVVLAQLHKKQVAAVPQRRAPIAAPAATQTPPATADANGVHAHREHVDGQSASGTATAAMPAQPARAAEAAGRKHHPLPLRIFFLVVCVGLFTSTITGIYMAYKYNRSRVWVTVALVAGVVVPLLLLIP